MTIIDELELISLQPDDRVLCDDCRHFKTKKWGGRCGANEVYYVGQKHRCAKSVVFLQQFINPPVTRQIPKVSSIWAEGDKPFWE